ncbi:MAG TPA: sigma-70 family RNA polymerase sigma factor [Solirubrobacter sp.]
MPEDQHARRPRPTSAWERRLIRLAADGDHNAQTELLARYEPLVRRVTRSLFLPGGDWQDIAQMARLAVLDAARCWDPRRGVPFSSFAHLCATREARMAVQSARAGKHQVLNRAFALDAGRADDEDGEPREEILSIAVVVAASRGDNDPVAKTIAREQLRGVVARSQTLSQLERRALAMAASDYSHREIAQTLCVGVRAVNNALQRARHKLAEPIAA